MKPLRTIIIDDEEGAHLVLEHYLKGLSTITLVGSFYNAIEAMDYIYRNPVDLAFLDINMPGLSGMEMLAALSFPPQFVLTTAHKEYALESYQYQVVDYLVKPIEFPRFLAAIDKVLLRFKPPAYSFEANGGVPAHPDFLMIRVDKDIVKVPLNEISYIQSLGNYVKVYTDSTTYVTPITTTEIEHNLQGAPFKRIHKSYIVALGKIKRISGGQVHLENDVVLPIGITFRRELLEQFHGK
ncbi:MAG TPA: LytTR family DNA-binding domain-containing protein [Pseudosphingobacterium sp.]|nr:LytTR family DNA-binding domain-containing protein [Pseudosphingobacterium sp.]